MTEEKQNIWASVFLAGYAALFAAGIFAPRMTALLPGIIALGGLLLYTFADKKNLRRLDFDFRLFLFPAAPFLIASVSYFWSVHPENALEKIVKIAPVILTGVALLHLAKKLPENYRSRLYKLFVYGLPFMLAVLAIEVIFRQSLFRLIVQIPAEEHIKFSRLNHGAVISSLLLWPVLIAAAASPKKYLAPVFFSATLLVVFLTNSQSAQIALLAGGMAAGLSIFFPALAFYGLLTGTGALIFGAPWIYKWLFEYWPSGLFRVKQSALDRLDVWYVFAKKIPENLYFGRGIEAARTVDMQSQKLLHFDGKAVLHPHSSILQIWFETGLIGVSVFYATIVFILLKIHRLPAGPLKNCTTGCFVSAFCVSIFGYGVWQGWLIGLYFIAAAALICSTPQPATSSTPAQRSPLHPLCAEAGIKRSTPAKEHKTAHIP